MNPSLKWLLIGIGLLIISTGFAKIAMMVFDMDMVRIMVTAIFNGIGTAIGIWVGTNLVIDKFKKSKIIEDSNEKVNNHEK